MYSTLIKKRQKRKGQRDKGMFFSSANNEKFIVEEERQVIVKEFLSVSVLFISYSLCLCQSAQYRRSDLMTADFYKVIFSIYLQVSL